MELQVTFTKRLSFKPTFEGHSIITYVIHASTKVVINTQNQCQIWPYIKRLHARAAEHYTLRSHKP